MSECSSPTENKVPIPSISPIRECHSETCLPLFLRESTAYSSLHESENTQNLKVQDASISQTFDFNEEVANETFINPISVCHQSEGDRKLTLAPNCSSPLNSTQTQIHFLSPDSFVNNRYTSDNDLKSMKNVLSDTFRKDPAESVCLESQTVHEVCQTILSPDSFLNDNYGLKKGLNFKSVNPVLSPTQFVKDSMGHVGQQTGKSNEASQDWRINEGLAYTPECQHAQTPSSRSEKQNPVEVKPHKYDFTKQKPKTCEFQDAFCHQSKQPHKRRPILSATVTKRKPTNAREKLPEINKPDAKRCLEGLVGQRGKEVGSLREKGFHPSLPVVEPGVSKALSYRDEVTPATVVVARKRKSHGTVGDANGKVAAEEWMDMCEVKRIHFSPLESTPSTVARTTKKEGLTSKRISSLERSGLKKKMGKLSITFLVDVEECILSFPVVSSPI